MFDNLSDRLQDVFDGLRGKGRLSEDDINVAMKEIRMALLEADVNYKVVKQFTKKTKERCLEADILTSLTPAQNVVKVVLEELSNLLGEDTAQLKISPKPPTTIMLVGLQGSGKTTACAKLAWRLKNSGHSPMLVACDVYRPAAIDQLQTLGDEMGIKVYRGEGSDPVEIARSARRAAIDSLRDVVIIDTAGRLHVDERMMREAADIKAATDPDNVLMVLDAMTGQDVVNVAQSFAEQVDFDGVILSKMDGDARGGGALSIREVTGKPIMFISSGEKPDSLEVFHPDRMAKRILGMGDVVTLIEKASVLAEEEVSKAEQERILKARFTFDDFLTSMKQIRKMGGLASLVSALPGGDKLVADGKVDEKEIARIEAIIRSMTIEERQKPQVINGSRRARIAKGAGVEVYDVNQLIKRFNDTKKMVKQMTGEMTGKKGKRKRRKMRGLGGLPGGLEITDELKDLIEKEL
ncbi:MAG: signal recognition particle protein [Actinomycetota bacterium]|nr:signal recognition particle protein [Actinomycetota bacterium]